MVSRLRGLDLARAQREHLGLRARALERAARPLELDAFDAVGGRDLLSAKPAADRR
jgi:hypothetical protein